MSRTAVAMVFVPLLALAAPALKGKAVYYHPTKVGDTRVYEMTVGERTSEQTDEVTKVESKDGSFHVTTTRTIGGKGTSTTAEVTAAGVVRLVTGNRPSSPPNRLLRLPAKAGETWAWERDTPDGGTIQKTAYTTGKEEEVQVPAGKFLAVRVDSARFFNGEQVGTASEWYAPGVGLVKAVTSLGDAGERTTVLKSFKPGK